MSPLMRGPSFLGSCPLCGLRIVLNSYNIVDNAHIRALRQVYTFWRKVNRNP